MTRNTSKPTCPHPGRRCRRRVAAWLWAPLALLLSGCATMPGQPMDPEVDAHLARMFTEQDRVNQQFSERLDDLIRKLNERDEAVKSALSQLQDELHRQGNENAELQKKLDQAEEQLNRSIVEPTPTPFVTPTPTPPPPPPPGPGESWTQAFGRGVREFDSGRYADAANSLQRAIEMNPPKTNLPDVLFYLGKAQMQTGQPDAAVENFNRIAKIDATHHLAWEGREFIADIFQVQGQIEQARQLYTQIVTVYPGYPEAERVRRKLAGLGGAAPPGQ